MGHLRVIYHRKGRVDLQAPVCVSANSAVTDVCHAYVGQR